MGIDQGWISHFELKVKNDLSVWNDFVIAIPFLVCF